jgi:hypothetical protein
MYPVKDNYTVGDTIWVEMDMSNIFTLWWYDSTKSMSAKLENFDFFRTYFIIYGLEDNSINMAGQPTRWQNFDFVIEKGEKLTDTPGGIWYKMAYEENRYRFKAALICNVTGYYSFRSFRLPMYSSDNYGMNNQDITSECGDEETIFEIFYPMNRQENGVFLTNHHIYEEALYLDPPGYIDEILKKQHFNFKVVD